jgi:hypothetical protein
VEALPLYKRSDRLKKSEPGPFATLTWSFDCNSNDAGGGRLTPKTVQ